MGRDLTIAAVLLGAWVAVGPASGAGAAEEPAPPSAPGRLVVAIREVPPFAMRDPAGNWKGLSVGLWQTVAERLGIAYEWRDLSLGQTLDALERREVDSAVAALTITAEREQRVDFSYPYMRSGLALAVDPSRLGWLATVRAFLSRGFFAAVSALVLVLFAAALAVWFFERRTNSAQFGGGTARGLWSSFWWSAVTMTTVGYGDKAPVTVGGRIVALIWMFTSVIVIASFTASIAASVTVNQLESDLLDERRLARTRIAVLTDSRGASHAAARGLRARPYPSLEAAAEALVRGEVEAVLHDAPILHHFARSSFDGGLEVLPGTLARDDYGFAFPDGSALREPVNVALLSIMNEPVWHSIRSRYLGEGEGEQ